MELQVASNRHGNPITTSHCLHLRHDLHVLKCATRRKRHKCAMKFAGRPLITHTEEEMSQMAQELSYEA
eukprot:6249120-Karenia_brevis.AAC.1